MRTAYAPELTHIFRRGDPVFQPENKSLSGGGGDMQRADLKRSDANTNKSSVNWSNSNPFATVKSSVLSYIMIRS